MYELNEFIRRGDAIKTILEKPDMTDDEKVSIILRINRIPAEDIQEIIRCNQCRFYEGVHGAQGHAPCRVWNMKSVLWNDFCSHAETEKRELKLTIFNAEDVKE